MSNLATQDKAELAIQQGQNAINALVLKGDTSLLSEPEKIQYYHAVCQSLGLNPATRPFEFLNFQATEDQYDNNGKLAKKGKPGKEVLYPNKNCAEQLRMQRGVSLGGPKFTFEGTDKQIIICEITAKTRDGREDTDIGVVDRTGGKDKWMGLGDAMLKATTKAKRRVTFSMIGLGFLNQIADAVDEGSAELLPYEIPLSQLHGVEYMNPDDFNTLTELAKAAELDPKALTLYLMSKYPGRGRAEIPADDFDAIAADFSNDEVVSHWNGRINPSVPIE